MKTDTGDGWRVVLFADAAGAIVSMADEFLTANGHRLIAVVTGPGPKRRRSDTYLEVVRATRPGVDVIVTTHMKRLAAMLAPLEPDLILCCSFLWLLPDDVIRLPRLGTINTHGGLLPNGRGPDPLGWAFRNDEGVLGWTVHWMTSDLDGGPILARAALPYGDEDDFETLFEQWIALIPQVWQAALEPIVRGDPGEPQSETDGYYAGFFEDKWRVIDWSQPARTIHNQVRSWHGARGVPKGARGDVGGQRMLITKTRLVDTSSPTASPGTLLQRDGDTILMQCGDRPLQILRWENV